MSTKKYNADNENMKKALQILSDGGYEMKLNKSKK